MPVRKNSLDLLLLLLLILIVAGLPYGIRTYDRMVWQNVIPADAREFTLTGNTEKGWLLGDVPAKDILSLGNRKGRFEKPVLEVSKGDLVVLKLKSMDVVHGFSLKAFGVFSTEGIHPGRVTLISFRADRVGSFTFSCNSICGSNHENMQGILVVSA